MLKCSEIVAQASDYLEKELSFSQRLQYQTHLLMCSNCRRFSRQFSAAVIMIRQLPPTSVAKQRLDEVKTKIDNL
tara:strand:- start:1944 stop:2168 length:225 start_codon:yes stop_codon:yes gene_type:complete